jgi:hypothetical protein
MLFVSGGANTVGIGASSPAADLHISSSGDEVLFRVDGNTKGTIFDITGSGLVTVTGDLSVCAGTASILHLSGCSPIQVHAPITSSYPITASNFVLPVGSGSFSGSNAIFTTVSASNIVGNSPLVLSASTITLSASTITLGTSCSDVVTVNAQLSASCGLSSSFIILDPTSGSLAGAGSYLGLDANNKVIVTSSAGGGGTPGGSDTQVQFNDGGSTFGGDSGLVFNKTTDTLTIGGDLSVCAGTASIAHLSGCSPIQVHAPMQIQSLDEGGILFAGATGSLSTDVDSLQWTTEREYNGGYIGLVVSSSASGSAALGDGMFMLSDATDELVCLITADGAEFAVNLSGSGDLNIGGAADIGGIVDGAGGFSVDGTVLVDGSRNASGVNNLTVGGVTSLEGNVTLGDAAGDEVTWKGNNCDFTNSNKIWKLADNSDGFGGNGPLLMFTGSGGDLLKFSTSGSRKGVVFPGTFYPGSDDSVDIGDSTYRFRNLYLADTAVVAGVSASANVSASYFYGDGSNLTNLPSPPPPPGGIFAELSATTAATTSSVKIGTGSAPMITLDVHYTGSGSPVNLSNDTGGGEVVYFGTASANLTAGGVYCLNAGGGWESADSANTGSGHNQLIGIAMGQQPEQDGVLIKGYFDVNTFYSGSFIKGAPIYIQSSSVGRAVVAGGYLSGAAPSAADSYVRVVGYGTDTPNVIYFNPDATYVEIG